jgi:hypothetical protein
VTTPPVTGKYTLFGTSACHLCELAEGMLEALCLQCPGLLYQKVDISNSDELFARYGVRIPVLRDDAGDRELGWPFSEVELRAFVAG